MSAVVFDRSWPLCWASLLAAACVLHAAAAFATTGEDRIVDPDISGPSAVETGAWRTKVQSTFDPSTRELVRRTYTLWDQAPSRDLDFFWTPARPEFDRDGKINGTGHLLWRRKGVPIYDDDAILAEYHGTLREGRLEGRGTYTESSGLVYEGEWRGGLMHGQGTLRLAGGDEYTGRFRLGKADGRGRYIEVTGEVYDGRFVGGLRHGRGITLLPDGRSYASSWQMGTERAQSRLVRLAQAPGAASSAPQDDIRLGISVDRQHAKRPPDAPTRKAGNLVYAVTNDASGLVIKPDNARLVGMWRGSGELQLTQAEEEGDSESGDEYGLLSLSRGQLVPLKLLLQVQNRSSRTAQVSGVYLDVQSSVSDLRPALQLRFGSFNSCNNDMEYKPKVKLENFGWGAAEDVSLQVAFPEANVSMSRSVQRIARAASIDLAADLAAAGLAVARLGKDGESGYQCRAAKLQMESAGRITGLEACRRELRGSGLFGRLTPHLGFEGTNFFVQGQASLQYSWKAADGSRQNATSRFKLTIPLGHIQGLAECGEGGQRQPITTKTQLLSLDRSGYRIPMAYRTDVRAGMTSQLTLPIEAQKSSDHRFRVVAQMSDGREIRSRPIHLQYYRPSWFPGPADAAPAAAAEPVAAPRATPAPSSTTGTGGSYRVTDSVSDNVLNMRRGPGSGHPLVAAIPKRSSGIRVMSCRAADDGSSRFPWCQVTWQGKSGWVSSCCIVDERTGQRP